MNIERVTLDRFTQTVFKDGVLLQPREGQWWIIPVLAKHSRRFRVVLYALRRHHDS
jgi:hypothetical protein